jgi:anti-anti-sigma regulatory factor
VRHALGGSRTPITVIQLVGEHDYGSHAMVVAALEPVNGHLVVDLTACTFIDTSLIGAVIAKALSLGPEGYRLELVVPPSAPFARTVDRLRVGMLLPVLEALPPLDGTSPSDTEDP